MTSTKDNESAHSVHLGFGSDKDVKASSTDDSKLATEGTDSTLNEKVDSQSATGPVAKQPEPTPELPVTKQEEGKPVAPPPPAKQTDKPTMHGINSVRANQCSTRWSDARSLLANHGFRLPPRGREMDPARSPLDANHPRSPPADPSRTRNGAHTRLVRPRHTARSSVRT